MFDSNHTHRSKSNKSTNSTAMTNDNMSVSSHDRSYSGFTTYSAGTSYTFHTVAESTVAQIFGSNTVRFHGRQAELDVLHGIYNEVCCGRASGSGNGNGNGNTRDSQHNGTTPTTTPTNSKDLHLQQEINIPDYHSMDASRSTVSTNTPSILRKVALISGISGTGKSALVQEFIQQLQSPESSSSNHKCDNKSNGNSNSNDDKHNNNNDDANKGNDPNNQEKNDPNDNNKNNNDIANDNDQDNDNNEENDELANSNHIDPSMNPNKEEQQEEERIPTMDHHHNNRNRNNNTAKTKEPLFLSGKFEEHAGANPYSAMVEAFTGLTSLLLEGKGSSSSGSTCIEEDSTCSSNGNHNHNNNKNHHHPKHAANANEYARDLVRIQRDVRVCLRPEDVTVLTSVVPALKKILLDVSSLPLPISTISRRGSNGQSSAETSNHHYEAAAGTIPTQNNNSWNRLKYVLQLFLRTIATQDRPVVMLLDDLQWADSASLELVQALVTDKRIRNFMFVGTYRSDAVDEYHPLSQKLSRISKTQPVETIKVGNLSLEQLIDFLHSHIKIHPFDCKNLAQKVHATTHGNLFFVIQVLVELNRQCALIYSEFRKEWEWDDVAGMLVLETGLSDNLEEAVEMKIRRSPKLIKKALVTMAYSRGTIDIETLCKLMDSSSGGGEDNNSNSNRRRSRRPIDMNQLCRALDRAVLEGFLSNSIGSNYYSFAHDKVLQGSYALIKEGRQRERFRLSMGRRLYKLGSSDAGETWMLFAAAEHLNSSLSLTDKDPLFLAKMNLDIGERASKVSAYDQASKCLMAGLEALLLIPDHDPWEQDYDLTLRLHRTIADVELYRGNFQSGNEIGRRLLEKAVTLQDKLPTYESLALALGREELHAEALDMNIDALKKLDEYPKRMKILVLLKELLTMMRKMKKISNSDMQKLPMMTDKAKETALVFARGLAIQGFYCDNNIEFLMGTVRALGITFQYGLSGYTSMSILAYGMIQSTIWDHAGALRGASLAKDILRKCENKEQQSVFNFCAAYFFEAWVDPHEKTLEAYRQGHLKGMELGDVESAFLNSYAAVQHAQNAGSPLGSIGIITRELLIQMDMYNMKNISVLSEQVYLSVQYLSGSIKGVEQEPPWDELAVEPSGDRRTSSYNMRLLHWYIARSELGVYYGNYEFADQMATQLKSVLPLHPAYLTRSLRLFYAGLAASGMARNMQKAGKRMQARRYRSKAKKLAATLGKYIKSAGANSYHRELILRADLKLLDKDQKQVSYDTAINACLEVGHIHEAALCSELAGEYYLAHSSDHKEGSLAASTNRKLICRHFTRARDLYTSWGAYGKVEHLQKRHGDYIEGKSNQCDNGGILSIDIENSFSRSSSDIDYSRHSSENDFSKGSSPPVLYNPRLLDLLVGIVPSSDTGGLSPMIPEKDLSDKNVGGDDVSMVSDIETDTF